MQLDQEENLIMNARIDSSIVKALDFYAEGPRFNSLVLLIQKCIDIILAEIQKSGLKIWIPVQSFGLGLK